MSTPEIVSKVETTIKADVAKEEAVVKTGLAAILAKTVSVKVLAIAVVGAFVAGLLAHVL